VLGREVVVVEAAMVEVVRRCVCSGRINSFSFFIIHFELAHGKDDNGATSRFLVEH
jgi:hypothetical protein